MGEFMVKRLYRKQQKNIRNIAHNIINFFHKELKGKYVFTQRIVGSGSLGTMLVDDNGDYDIDYQILLTNRSKIDLSNATQIKNDFFNCLQSYKDKEQIEMLRLNLRLQHLLFLRMMMEALEHILVVEWCLIGLREDIILINIIFIFTGFAIHFQICFLK